MSTISLSRGGGSCASGSLRLCRGVGIGSLHRMLTGRAARYRVAGWVDAACQRVMWSVPATHDSVADQSLPCLRSDAQVTAA